MPDAGPARALPSPPPPAAATESALRSFLDRLPPLDLDGTAGRAERIHRDAGEQRRSAPDIDRVLSVLDLTLLAATATAADVRTLCRRAQRPDPDDESAPPVAAVCVTPDLVATAADVLATTPVRVASVAGGFPTGRTLRSVKITEVSAAVAAGADEIDAVVDRAALREGRIGHVVAEIAALRDACGGALLKIILETGAMGSPDQVRRAAWLALIGGADILKTSTGTLQPGATPAAVLILLEVAEAYQAASGRAVGVKVAGGVGTAEQALGYLRLARSCGDGAIGPKRLRIGASSLLDALVGARRAPTGPVG